MTCCWGVSSAVWDGEVNAISVDVCLLEDTRRHEPMSYHASFPAAVWQHSRISASVRQRFDCLARENIRSTISSVGVIPLRSSQKVTLDFPDIGPISMICSNPK